MFIKSLTEKLSKIYGKSLTITETTDKVLFSMPYIEGPPQFIPSIQQFCFTNTEIVSTFCLPQGTLKLDTFNIEIPKASIKDFVPTISAPVLASGFRIEPLEEGSIRLTSGHHEYKITDTDGYLTLELVGSPVYSQIKGSKLLITDLRHKHLVMKAA